MPDPRTTQRKRKHSHVQHQQPRVHERSAWCVGIRQRVRPDRADDKTLSCYAVMLLSLTASISSIRKHNHKAKTAITTIRLHHDKRPTARCNLYGLLCFRVLAVVGFVYVEYLAVQLKSWRAVLYYTHWNVVLQACTLPLPHGAQRSSCVVIVKRRPPLRQHTKFLGSWMANAVSRPCGLAPSARALAHGWTCMSPCRSSSRLSRGDLVSAIRRDRPFSRVPARPQLRGARRQCARRFDGSVRCPPFHVGPLPALDHAVARGVHAVHVRGACRLPSLVWPYGFPNVNAPGAPIVYEGLLMLHVVVFGLLLCGSRVWDAATCVRWPSKNRHHFGGLCWLQHVR